MNRLKVVYHPRFFSTTSKKWMIRDEMKMKVQSEKGDRKPRRRRRKTTKVSALGNDFNYETIPELWLSAQDESQSKRQQ